MTLIMYIKEPKVLKCFNGESIMGESTLTALLESPPMHASGMMHMMHDP